MPHCLQHFPLKGLRMAHVIRKPDEHGDGYQTLHVDPPAEDCSLAPQSSCFFVILEWRVDIALVVLGNGLRHSVSDDKMCGR